MKLSPSPVSPIRRSMFDVRCFAFLVLLLGLVALVYDPHHILSFLSFTPFLLGINAQVGRQIRVQSPPKFSNCTVRGGTWEEDDATQVENNLNADEEQFNTTAYNEGENVRCELFPDATFAPAVNDVLTEIDVDSPRSWVINSVNRGRFGKRGLVYKLTLSRHTAQDTTIVS